MSGSKAKSDSSIARNKKAWHDYFIEEEFEAGLVLEGWEVKKSAGRSRTAQGRLCDHPYG